MFIGSIIGWIILGAILGGLARLLVPGPDPIGLAGTIVLGIAGQVIAGLIFYFAFGTAGAGWIAGLVVSILLLLLERRTRAGRRRRGARL